MVIATPPSVSVHDHGASCGFHAHPLVRVHFVPVDALAVAHNLVAATADCAIDVAAVHRATQARDAQAAEQPAQPTLAGRCGARGPCLAAFRCGGGTGRSGCGLDAHAIRSGLVRGLASGNPPNAREAHGQHLHRVFVIPRLHVQNSAHAHPGIPAQALAHHAPTLAAYVALGYFSRLRRLPRNVRRILVDDSRAESGRRLV